MATSHGWLSADQGVDGPNAWPAETGTDKDKRFIRLKQELHEQLITRLDLSAIGTISEDELRLEVRRAAEELCRLGSELLSLGEQERLVNEVLDETFGMGPLETLMRDPTITDILINGPKTCYIERNGRLEQANIVFNDDRHLIQIVQRIVGRVGRRVDETKPMVDARLPDGSRINAVIPPLALDGSLVSIRRFGGRPLLSSDLLAKKAITKDMLDFLAACIEARVNIVISGGTGSGKTTLMNALSVYIPHTERVVTIEDAAELRLQQPHVARMETRPANIEGTGEVTTRDLVRNALRMRPDRIIIGECRGPEALDMLQAMNTGHDGSLTTIHANDTRDALSRLEMMVGMSGFDVPIWVTRRQIASAIHIVVQAARLTGGMRKIVKISEITGIENDVIAMHDLFGYKQTGVDENRNAVGHFYVSGIRPHCLGRLDACGVGLPTELFERRILPI
jgi:pilus assembly protein CpaF